MDKKQEKRTCRICLEIKETVIQDGLTVCNKCKEEIRKCKTCGGTKASVITWTWVCANCNPEKYEKLVLPEGL